MRRALLIFVSIAWLARFPAKSAGAQSTPSSSPEAPVAGARVVDGVAARIEDDVLTESEVRELAAFQQLVDGHAKPRTDLIRELADQWIVRSEADAESYPSVSADDLANAYSHLVARFSSPDEFKNRCAAVGLSEPSVRRMLVQQLYLSRFLEYRFRPAAQVDQKQIEAYYNDEFAPQLKARNEAVPPLDDVTDTIREVLVQRAINDRATQWLDETRERLKIDILSQGNHR